VSDDVVIQVLVDFLARLRIEIKQEMIRPAQHVHIGENPTLPSQKKRVTASSGRKLLDIIGSHGMQQPRTILAQHFDLAAAGKIQPSSAVSQRVVTGHFREMNLRYAE